VSAVPQPPAIRVARRRRSRLPAATLTSNEAHSESGHEKFRVRGHWFRTGGHRRSGRADNRSRQVTDTRSVASRSIAEIVSRAVAGMVVPVPRRYPLGAVSFLLARRFRCSGRGRPCGPGRLAIGTAVLAAAGTAAATALCNARATSNSATATVREQQHDGRYLDFLVTAGRQARRAGLAVPAHKLRSADFVPPGHSEFTYLDLLVYLHNGLGRKLVAGVVDFRCGCFDHSQCSR
jgi:hypothetical protein